MGASIGGGRVARLICIVRIAKSLLKQDSYGEKLKEKLEALRTQANLFKRSAQLCLYETSVDTQQELKSHRVETRTYQAELVDRLDKSDQRADQKIERLEKRVRFQDRVLGEILKTFLCSNSQIDFSARDG